MVYKEQIVNVKLLASEKLEKRDRDIKYLMELDTFKLLFHYYTEAGVTRHMNIHIADLDLNDGWDNTVCQVRGMFTGHWLSAASRIYQETGYQPLKGKIDYIVSEIGKCQDRNGNGWGFSIPEKYMYGIKRGVNFWAPQYVCHKQMLGLLEAYQFAGNEQALEILLKCADWFYEFNLDVTRENMDDMMDLEETGGMMEFWGDLYLVTKDPRHLELMYKYERPRLTGPILEGIDVLTNMHANMTIPEIHGCAKAYEITGDERFRKIVENYWSLAVTQRGMFATGGQTDGEIWTPMQVQASRLSALNQEHCVVYNMIRLADYLYRWTGEVEYLDYIERNIENGLMAQGFWKAEKQNMTESQMKPDEGLVAYFLPLASGSSKHWGTKTKDFWCCHGTLVQANAKYREYVYYKSDKNLTIAQFIPAEIDTDFFGVKVKVCQTVADLSGGDFLKISPIAREIPVRPEYMQMCFDIQAEEKINYSICFRMPWWLKGKMEILVNGEPFEYEKKERYAIVTKEWLQDKVIIKMPYGITCWRLADEPNTVAFLTGPIVLAGLVDEERILEGEIEHPETMIKPHHTRQWADWTLNYKTVNQRHGFYLKPIKDIGNQTYTVYFPVKERKV